MSPVRLFLAVALLVASAAPTQAVESVRADRHSAAIGGDVHGDVTVGLTPKQVQELVQQILSEEGVDLGALADKLAELGSDLGVTQGAVKTFLGILGEKNVPIEDLPGKLAEIADRHKALLQEIGTLRSESPDVQAIRDQARAAVESGDYARAGRLLEQAKSALRIDQANQTLLEAASIEAELGELALTQLDYAGAAGHFADAADMVPRSVPLVRADHLNRQGQAAYFGGDYATAEEAWAEALALREEHLDPDDPDLGTSLNNLAELYRTTGRYGEAEPLYERAMAIDEAALGTDHPNLARDLNNLALLYSATGRYGEAEPLYERALRITEAALGPEHPNVATALNNLAELYRVTGRYGEAEPLYERAIVIFEASFGPDHPHTKLVRRNLAGLREAMAERAVATEQ